MLLQCAANPWILPALWDYPQQPLQLFAIRCGGAESLRIPGPFRSVLPWGRLCA
ncbi:hypothetical protein DP44_5370 [Burkholderia pseudomallei]|nr:hypothetical protein DP44_5370 [Burkholderia pseudomallei]